MILKALNKPFIDNLKNLTVKYILIFVLLFSNTFSFSQKTEKKQEPVTTRILFILDASQSMYGRWQSNIKIVVAKNILSNLLDSLKNVENLELALRVFGHQKNYPPQDCDDTKLEVPFSKNNFDKIKHKLKIIVPKGTTPITRSLEEAGNDFPPYYENCRNIIILITDGIEECGGDPCIASHALQKKGISLKPFIIGIGRDFSEEFKCVGTYFNASDERSFKKILNVVISKVLNPTTAQVNLLDNYGNPTETNVNMTFYDNLSGLVKYNFIHTLNNRGLPDTLVIDPLMTYDIVVHTIPCVRVDSIKLNPGKHKIIPIDAPQGSLKLKIKGKSAYKNLQCIVRQSGKMETINVQPFRQEEKYIVGEYDLEVLCLPRLIIKNIEILQSHTTSVEIPSPGIAIINKSANGYGSLYLEKDNKLELIYNLKVNSVHETIALQPGKYRVVFRPKEISKTIYTVEKSFDVKSNSTIKVDLY